jgi:hypothetical protein
MFPGRPDAGGEAAAAVIDKTSAKAQTIGDRLPERYGPAGRQNCGIAFLPGSEKFSVQVEVSLVLDFPDMANASLEAAVGRGGILAHRLI